MQLGFIIINKPKGITSHDVIKRLRGITNIKKIGHAGTLDPLATGVLVCAIGREATKNISKFVKSDKEYIAKIKLGERSDTYDAEGKIEKVSFDEKPALSKIRKVLKKFTGEIKQTPPVYSAKKIKGKKAYEFARGGEEIKLKPVRVKINKIDILEYKWPYLKIKTKVSSGTYIRSLANDVGRALGAGGYLADLKRTIVENFSIDDAIRLDSLNKNNWGEYLINL